jgi:hypothetical protein
MRENGIDELQSMPPAEDTESLRQIDLLILHVAFEGWQYTGWHSLGQMCANMYRERLSPRKSSALVVEESMRAVTETSSCGNAGCIQISRTALNKLAGYSQDGLNHAQRPQRSRAQAGHRSRDTEDSFAPHGRHPHLPIAMNERAHLRVLRGRVPRARDWRWNERSLRAFVLYVHDIPLRKSLFFLFLPSSNASESLAVGRVMGYIMSPARSRLAQQQELVQELYDPLPPPPPRPTVHIAVRGYAIVHSTYGTRHAAHGHARRMQTKRNTNPGVVTYTS